MLDHEVYGFGTIASDIILNLSTITVCLSVCTSETLLSWKYFDFTVPLAVAFFKLGSAVKLSRIFLNVGFSRISLYKAEFIAPSPLSVAG